MGYRDANSLLNFSSFLCQCSFVTGGFDKSGSVNRGELVYIFLSIWILFLQIHSLVHLLTVILPWRLPSPMLYVYSIFEVGYYVFVYMGQRRITIFDIPTLQINNNICCSYSNIRDLVYKSAN